MECLVDAKSAACEVIHHVEAVVDRTGIEHHELAGRAKDMASAAVAISLLLMAIVYMAYAWSRFGA